VELVYNNYMQIRQEAIINFNEGLLSGFGFGLGVFVPWFILKFLSNRLEDFWYDNFYHHE